MAEVRKRGDEFWSEFEFYLSDLCVGLVLDVVLVTLISPVARPGRPKREFQTSAAACCCGGGWRARVPWGVSAAVSLACRSN